MVIFANKRVVGAYDKPQNHEIRIRKTNRKEINNQQSS